MTLEEGQVRPDGRTRQKDAEDKKRLREKNFKEVEVEEKQMRGGA